MEDKKRKSDICVLLFLFAMIVVTRIAVIQTHLHTYPDEVVFTTSAYRLSRFLIGSLDVYKPYKPYPEGTFTLQVPMQLVVAVFGKLFHFQPDVNDRIVGRISSICFFCAAVGIGVYLLRKRLPEHKQSASVFYMLTMLFGVMHIEQSRYGIGNAPTYFFIMLLIAMTDCALCSERHRMHFFFLAYICVGMLASIKYPQAYFAVIPLWASIQVKDDRQKFSTTTEVFRALVGIILGFFLLSPKSLVEPSFIYRAIVSETSAYVGNSSAHRDILGHITECLIYILFYSGMPILSIAIVLPLLGKRERADSALTSLYFRIIPISICIFVVYNLFAKLFALRNLYPAIVLCDFYAAAFAAKLFAGGKREKTAIILLTAALCLRGVYYDYALIKDDPFGRFQRLMSQIDPAAYEVLTELTPGWVAFDTDAFTERYPCVDLRSERFDSENGFALKKGEFFVSTCQEYYFCNNYPFSILSAENKELNLRWKKFKTANEKFIIDEFYPRHYYYVFGYWIPGTTGAGVEFPFHVFYLNPADT